MFLSIALAVVLAAMAVYYVAAGGLTGRLIDVDRAPPWTARFLVDINTAPWPEIAQLPEVGDVLAQRVVESREREGPFRSVEDLDRVAGIGPATIDLVRPYVLIAEPDEN
jgi:competence protein ComEA